MIKKHFILLSVLFMSSMLSAQLSLYTSPKDYDYANDFKVTVNNQESFVYNNRVAAFTNFSFAGKVEVAVDYPGTIYTVDIRPKNLHINYTVKGKKILFTLDKPANLSIEVNRNINRPLFVFANAPETGRPDKNAKNVYYFEGGKVHEPGKIILKNDDIVYIEGGAVVKGSFYMDSCNRVRIYGRGILSGECLYKKGERRMIEISRSRDIRVEGIIINDSRHWTAPCTNSENITYRNLKIVSGNDWDDGIDIVSSRKVVVDSCFIRTKDDCIAIKGGVDYLDTLYNQFTASDIRISNCVLWNAEWGNAIEIGFETRCDTIRNIVFSNIDLIHVEGTEGTFSIHNGDRAVVDNVLYENIRVEDAQGILVDFKILESQYSKDKKRGQIQNIQFKNIFVNGYTGQGSVMEGFNEKHMIKNVRISNFNVNGKKITGPFGLNLRPRFTSGLKFNEL